MKTLRRIAHGNVWLYGAVLAWSLLFLACSTTRTIVSPVQIPGADYIGSAECATCHSEVTDGFKHATHSGLTKQGDKGMDISCESCHGPGSKHSQAGGGRGVFILNPGRETAVCYQCHLDKRGEFALPNAHPVASGKMSCTDCHNPHKGNAVPGGGTALEGPNETCFQCHSAQRGPYVFEHEASREGCVICHSPHGSVNAKMLKTRNQNLCLQCHFQQQTGTGLFIGGRDHASFLSRGTCWTAGCHEAVHGSHVNSSLRF